MLLLEKYY